MPRKHDVIEALIDLGRWRKQLRYAAKHDRLDLAADAVDNGFACVAMAIKASITPRRARAWH